MEFTKQETEEFKDAVAQKRKELFSKFKMSIAPKWTKISNEAATSSRKLQQMRSNENSRWTRKSSSTLGTLDQ